MTVNRTLFGRILENRDLYAAALREAAEQYEHTIDDPRVDVDRGDVQELREAAEQLERFGLLLDEAGPTSDRDGAEKYEIFRDVMVNARKNNVSYLGPFGHEASDLGGENDE